MGANLHNENSTRCVAVLDSAESYMDDDVH